MVWWWRSIFVLWFFIIWIWLALSFLALSIREFRVGIN